MSSEIFYLSTSGIEVHVLKDFNPGLTFEEMLNTKTSEWFYILIPRRTVGFATVFKYITQHCYIHLCFVRIYFYELREQPINLTIYVPDRRSIILIHSVPSLTKLLKRIIANPKYSETVVFIAKIPNKNIGIDRNTEEKIKLARKLFMELSPIIFSRGFGRLLALVIKSLNAGHQVTLCVEKPGIAVQSGYEGVSLIIKSIEKCLEEIDWIK
jgi:hypothetical protein